jgi:hypothetical protein
MNTTTKPAIAAGLFLMLVAGAAFAGGVATERLALSSAPDAAVRPAPPEGGMRVLIRDRDSAFAGGERRVRFMLPARLGEELQLTEQQQAEVAQILAEHQSAIRAIMDAVEPALMAEVERSRQRIFEVLTEEQAARWESMPALRVRHAPPASTMTPGAVRGY